MTTTQNTLNFFNPTFDLNTDLIINEIVLSIIVETNNNSLQRFKNVFTFIAIDNNQFSILELLLKKLKSDFDVTKIDYEYSEVFNTDINNFINTITIINIDSIESYI